MSVKLKRHERQFFNALILETYTIKNTHISSRQCLVFSPCVVKNRRMIVNETKQRAEKEKNILSILINVTKKCRTLCVCVDSITKQQKKWGYMKRWAREGQESVACACKPQNHSLALSNWARYSIRKSVCVCVYLYKHVELCKVFKN
jgi:hypothetical protein